MRVTLQTVDEDVPVTIVHATHGKRTRAEPVAALYDGGPVSRTFPTPRSVVPVGCDVWRLFARSSGCAGLGGQARRRQRAGTTIVQDDPTRSTPPTGYLSTSSCAIGSRNLLTVLRGRSVNSSRPHRRHAGAALLITMTVTGARSI